MPVRRIYLFTLALMPCTLLACPATAAVFERDLVPGSGDGLLTFDDVNNREWLDLTETQLFKFPGDTLEEQYQSVVDETYSTGMFADFTVAVSSDVIALTESAGIDTSTQNWEINRAASGALVNLLGRSHTSTSFGVVADLSRESSVAVFVFSGREEGLAGLNIGDSMSDLKGVWLYRPIPEPSSLFLASGIVCGLLAVRPRG